MWSFLPQQWCVTQVNTATGILKYNLEQPRELFVLDLLEASWAVEKLCQFFQCQGSTEVRDKGSIGVLQGLGL